MPYKLSNVLAAHGSDVRAVASPSSTLVLSASRDTTAISWERDETNQPFKQSAVYQASSRYVNSIAYLPPNTSHPQGLVITGGQDAIVNAFVLGSDRAEPVYSLLGHQNNICALDTTGESTIISGSWDNTARVWQDFQPSFELIGHEQAVWAVVAIHPTSFLTGSADRTIKLWEQHKNVRTYKGHTDAIRALALISDVGFASCSNDGEIRVSTYGGDTLHTLSGHTSFVYSLAVLPSGELVSGGEDRCVRIWRDGSCVQTIVHPAISVWTVSVMSNGDIVSGCSDGIVRVFSEAEDRWAPQEELQRYDEQIANQSLPSQQIGDVKKSDLPGLDALLEPGKKDGQVKMVRNNNGVVEAHQWNSGAFQWQKVGEVVDAIGSGRKQLYEGKEYDYVFDVDIQDGVPPLKLPYSVNENPYEAAQRFLTKNDLPLSYIDQVVAFIEKNSKPVTVGASQEEFVDPFTGASRYRAGTGAAQSAQTSSSGAYHDPFTGASRYQPPAAGNVPPNSAGAQGDPFTGGSRYQATPQENKQTPKVIPISEPLSFKQANVSAIKSKLYAFNNEVDASLQLTPSEQGRLDEVFTALTVAISTRASNTNDLLSIHIETVAQVLVRWPPQQCFPLIDLARLICGFSARIHSETLLASKLFQALERATELTSEWKNPLEKHRDVNTLLFLRTLANAIHQNSSPDVIRTTTKVLETLRKAPYAYLNKNQKVALATCLFNLSAAEIKNSKLAGVEIYHEWVTKIIKEEREDSEAGYRALVAFGNIVYSCYVRKERLSTEMVVLALESVPEMQAKFAENRAREIVTDIQDVVQLLSA